MLRRFSEQSGEEAGEHFTPREVIRLMVELLEIPIPDKHISIYDPACGTGGMLSVTEEHLLDRANTAEEKARVEKFLTIHREEISPTNYAICQADLLIKNDQQAKVHLGNSLIHTTRTAKNRVISFLSRNTCLTLCFRTRPSALWDSRLRDAVTRLAVLTEQKLREEIGAKKQEKAFPVPLEVPPSYLELIQNRVSS